MKFKKLIISAICMSLIFGSFVYAIPSNSTTKQENIYKGQVHLEGKEWQSKIEYVVGQDNIPFEYDKQYLYKDENYEGYLNAKKVIITPKQKNENTSYKTEYKTFYKQHTGNYGNNSNWNFSDTYLINEDGYYGNIYFKSSSWRDNWVTNRWQYIDVYWSTGWKSVIDVPYDILYGYYDHVTGQTIHTYLDHIRTVDVQETTGYRYSESYGDRYNYSQRNENLGYMSQNSTTYQNGAYRYSNSPRRPNDYYGPESDKYGWELVQAWWADDQAYSADSVSGLPEIRQHLTYSSGSWWWKSELGVLNKYRKGVYLEYRKPITLTKVDAIYGGWVRLPDYISDYTGTAYYEGTLSKQVSSTYYTSNYWDVEIVYEGTVGLKKVQVSGQITPNPTTKGSKITFDLTTRYYPNQLEIFIPSELQRYFSGRSSITLGIKEEIYLNTRHQEILDLNIPETVDKDNNRLREPYEFNVKATRSDGSTDTSILKLDVSGSILNNLKTVIVH